ncbi:MAG: MATE family efflux transporter [Succinatimonas sp.]|nr:MATE family efflux transporter [Succinatimonas sp.]
MFTYKFPFLKVPYKVELKTQLKIFVPLILGEICFAAMSTVDTVMASLAGTSDLSGVALGTALYWPVLMMLIGICTTVIPTVSMLKAQKNLHEIQKKYYSIPNGHVLYYCFSSGCFDV